MIFYRIYQFLIMMPLLLVATFIAATLTIIGSVAGFGRTMGYWPGRIWARVFCLLSWVKVEVRGRENIDPATSYVFVANHQGAYDIFAIYGYLGHNFRWMMKKALRRYLWWATAVGLQGIFMSTTVRLRRCAPPWKMPRNSWPAA